MQNFIILSFITVFSIEIEALDLLKTLEIARKNALEHIADEANLNSEKTKLEKLDDVYTPTIYADYINFINKKDSPTNIYLKKTEGKKYNIGVKKMFSTGTVTNLSFSHNNTDLSIENPSASIQSLEQAQQQQSSQNTTNPLYTSELKLEIVQPLWKNFNASIVKQQRKVVESSQIKPKYSIVIKKQMLQAEVESIFLKILLAKYRINIIEQVIKKSSEYVTLFKQRLNYGRAESTDVVSAESKHITYEGQLLDLQIELQMNLNKLSFLLNSSESPNIEGHLDKPLLSSSDLSLSEEELVQNTLKSRLDLKSLTEQTISINANTTLADEKSKAKIDFFVSFSANSQKDNAKDTFSKLSKFENNDISFGLKFSKKIGDITHRATIKDNISRKLTISANKALITRNIKRDINAVKFNYDSAARQIAQSKRGIGSLEELLKKEKKKIAQARSEAIVIISYEIAILNAQIPYIISVYKQRLAEAQYRKISQLYPKEEITNENN